jgi:hypothetical protein
LTSRYQRRSQFAQTGIIQGTQTAVPETVLVPTGGTVVVEIDIVMSIIENLLYLGVVLVEYFFVGLIDAAGFGAGGVGEGEGGGGGGDGGDGGGSSGKGGWFCHGCLV